jgi:VanZ family protein
MLAVMKPGQLLGFSTLDPLLTEVDNVDLTEHSVSSSRNPLHHVARMLRQGGGNNNGNESDTGTVGDGADTRSLGQLSTGVLSHDDPTLLEDGAVPVREIPRELISEPASLPVSRDTSESNLLSRNVTRSGGTKYNDNRRTSLHMHQEELRCVIAVVRHGDRTPKEKLKMNTKEPIILQYFIDHSVDKKENSTKDLKVKAKGPMVDFLGAVRKIIEKYESKVTSSPSLPTDGDDDDETSENNKLLWKFKHMVRYFYIFALFCFCAFFSARTTRIHFCTHLKIGIIYSVFLFLFLFFFF